MHIIIQAWAHACSIFHPKSMLKLLGKSTKTYLTALVQFTKNFGWLIAVDALFLCSVGDILSRATQAQAQAGKGVDGTLLLITLIHSIVWFIVTSAFFLLIRKPNDLQSPKEYFRLFFYRYVQLLMLISFVILIFIYFILSMGITKIPTQPWIFLVGLKFIEMCMAFYWLDSDGYFMDMVRSFEKTINMIFYNAPFFVVMLGFLWLLDYGLSMGLSTVVNIPASHTLFSNVPLFQAASPTTFLQTCKVLCVKYSIFLVECFFVSIIFSVYRRKHRERYAPSLFDGQ